MNKPIVACQGLINTTRRRHQQSWCEMTCFPIQSTQIFQMVFDMQGELWHNRWRHLQNIPLVPVWSHTDSNGNRSHAHCLLLVGSCAFACIAALMKCVMPATAPKHPSPIVNQGVVPYFPSSHQPKSPHPMTAAANCDPSPTYGARSLWTEPLFRSGISFDMKAHLSDRNQISSQQITDFAWNNKWSTLLFQRFREEFMESYEHKPSIRK